MVRVVLSSSTVLHHAFLQISLEAVFLNLLYVARLYHSLPSRSPDHLCVWYHVTIRNDIPSSACYVHLKAADTPLRSNTALAQGFFSSSNKFVSTLADSKVAENPIHV